MQYNFNPYQQPNTMYQNQYGQQTLYNSNNTMNNRQEVVRVNGMNGANAYQLPPNSSILLLDDSAPIVWLKITDGAGYPTLTPYDIVPHKKDIKQVTDTSLLEERINKLEETVNELLSQSNVEHAQPIKRIKESKSS